MMGSVFGATKFVPLASVYGRLGVCCDKFATMDELSILKQAVFQSTKI
jgi:hypothetical protein